MVNNKSCISAGKIIGRALLLTCWAAFFFLVWLTYTHTAEAAVDAGRQVEQVQKWSHTTWRPGDVIIAFVFCRTPEDANDLSVLAVANDEEGLNAGLIEKYTAGLCMTLKRPASGILVEPDTAYPSVTSTVWKVEFASNSFVWLLLDDASGPHPGPGSEI